MRYFLAALEVFIVGAAVVTTDITWLRLVIGAYAVLMGMFIVFQLGKSVQKGVTKK